MYTDEDIDNSVKFAETNTNIRYLKAIHNKAPWIASKLKYKFRDATDDDYYLPVSLAGLAKIMTIEITEEACNALSCNPSKKDGMCTPADTALYYTIDGTTSDIACQPACFNLAAKPTITDGERAADTPMLVYNKAGGFCAMAPTPYMSYLEKTFYRNKTQYVNRDNNMPTGFTRVQTDSKFGTGIQYKANDNYCNYFYKHYQASTDNCTMTIPEKILDAVIGQSLIAMVRDGINKATTGSVMPSPSIAPFPDLPETMTLEGWKNDVNKDFVLPEVIDYLSAPDTVRQNYENHRSKRSVQAPNSDHPIDVIKFKKQQDKERLLNYRKQMEMDTPVTKYTKKRLVRSLRADDKDDDDDDDDNPDKKSKWEELAEVLPNIPIQLLESLCTDPEFLISIGISVATDSALAKFKVKMAELLIKLSNNGLTKLLETLTAKIGSKVIQNAFKSAMKSAITKFAIKIISKVAIFLAKLAIAIASVVEWILILTMLFDLLFSFWSPTGMSNLFPPGYSQMLFAQGESSYRLALGVANPQYSFAYIVNTVLSTDECMEIILEGLNDRLIYLDALVVNSEGSRIDKGDEIAPTNDSVDNYTDTTAKAAAAQYHFNYDTFNQYNERFHHRVQTNAYLGYALIGFGVATLFSAAIQQFTLAILLAIICIIIAYVNSTLITDNYFMNTLYPNDFILQS